MKRAMKAVMCHEPHSLGIVDRPAPQAGDKDVLIRIRSVGLCGTDYHIFAGRHPFLQYPRVMGHELAGEIVQAPSGSALRVGQTVAVNPYLACGTCIACRKGKPNACVNIRVLGVHTDGGMCELLAVPEHAVIDATGLTLDQAAMIEFLSIGHHAVTRAALSAGARVLVCIFANAHQGRLRTQKRKPKSVAALRTRSLAPSVAIHQSAAFSAGFCRFINSTSRQSDCNSRTSTLNDSGTPGSMPGSPLTMAS